MMMKKRSSACWERNSRGLACWCLLLSFMVAQDTVVVVATSNDLILHGGTDFSNEKNLRSRMDKTIGKNQKHKQQQESRGSTAEEELVKELVVDVLPTLDSLEEAPEGFESAVGANELAVIYKLDSNPAIASLSESNTSSASSTSSTSVNVEEAVLIEAMREKLKPKFFRFEGTTGPDGRATLAKHQFLHLHHMKTGGTSMDSLISCGRARLEQMNVNVPSYNIHECNEMGYRTCIDGTNSYCQKSIHGAAVLSYCAPLKDLASPFQWTEQAPDHPNKIHAVTVFRHPVSRVWSMYRFQTKSCYSCRPLKEIYEILDNPDDDDASSSSASIRSMCAMQISNHLTRNLLSSEQIVGYNKQNLQNETAAQQLVQNAITNMKNFLTFVGMTEDMNTTAKITAHVFPWLAETVPNSTLRCTLPHANASPSNNRCGPDGTHLPLPDHPDEETTAIILKHNEIDMKLYEAAVEQFRIQKLALNL